MRLLWGSRIFFALIASSLAAQQPANSSTKFYPAHRLGAANTSKVAMDTSSSSMAMPQVAPIFVEDDKSSTSVVVANDSAIPAGATVSVFSLSGQKVGGKYLMLAPNEKQEVSLQSLLIDAQPATSIGSVLVEQDANLKGMTVISQALITSRREPTSYVDEELAMPSTSGSSVLRGVADEAIGTALLAVTNVEMTPQHVTLRCLSEKGEQPPVTTSIGAMETLLFSSCSGRTVANLDAYLQDVGNQQADRVEAYELTNDGGPGTIAAFGLAPHSRGHGSVFSAIPFTDPELINSPNLTFAGVPFGTQPTLPDGVYTPRISLSNFALTPAHVTVSIATTQQTEASASSSTGNQPARRALRSLTIAPRHTVEFTLEDAASQSGLLQSLLIDTDKNPGEVECKVVSRSDGTLYEIELLGKDRLDENNGGIHPWSVEDDYESHLLLFNYSAQPQKFDVAISNGAILWDKKYSLAPNETREISFNELIQDKVPDDKGQILSPDRPFGVVDWMVPDSGNATGRLMVTSRSNGMARNFSCGKYTILCGLDFVDMGNGVFDILSGASEYPWEAIPLFCMNYSPQCTGGSSASSGSASLTWTISPSSVIKPSSPSQLTAPSPLVTGVAPGAGTGNVEAAAGMCWAYGSGPAQVPPSVYFTPQLTSILQGSSATVTVNVNYGQTTSPSPVTLTLATTSGAGAAIFVPGGSGTIAPGGASTAITATTTVTIQGVTASSTANNITLTAYYPNGDSPFELVQQAFSVVLPAVAPNIKSNTNNNNDVVGDTQNVVVGQQIVLTEDVPSPQNQQIQSRSWTVTSGTAVAGFSGSVNSGTVATLQRNSNTSSYTLYWTSSGDPLTVTYNYTLTNGQTSPSVTATFNVTGPSGVAVAPVGQEFFVGNNPPAMNWGIQFNATASPPSGYPGNFSWIQIIQSVVDTSIYSDGSPVVCTGGPGFDAGETPTYPYATGLSAEDGPSDPLTVPPELNQTEEQSSASMQMYLMWNPGIGSGSSASIPVPLGSIPWNTAGDVVWTSATQAWQKKAGASNATTNGTFVPSATYPTWTSPVTPQTISATCKEQ